MTEYASRLGVVLIMGLSQFAVVNTTAASPPVKRVGAQVAASGAALGSSAAESDSFTQGAAFQGKSLPSPQSSVEGIPLPLLFVGLSDNDIRSAIVSAIDLEQYDWSVGLRADFSHVGDNDRITTPTLLRFGVYDGLEIRLASELLRILDGAVGRPDLTAGFKLGLLRKQRVKPGASGWRLGILVDSRFGFEADAMAMRVPDNTLRSLVLGDVQLGRAWVVRSNIGVQAHIDSGDIDVGFAYGIEVSYLVDRWAFFAGNAGVVHATADISTHAGIACRLADTWQLGASGHLGVTQAADDFGGGLFARWQPW